LTQSRKRSKKYSFIIFIISMTNKYEIQTGDIEPIWPIKKMYEAGVVQPCTVEGMLNPTVGVREEERQISLFDPNVESPTFDRTRKHFQEAFRAAVGHFYRKYNIAKQGGLDIGSGATGQMVHNFLDGTISKNSWTEMDINAKSVEANSKLHPGSRIIKASYHDLDALNLHETLDVVTGLSTLDATQHIPHAIGQIRKALRKGGYLFHVQDVRPGNGAGIRELMAMGIKPPYQCLAVDSGSRQPGFVAFGTDNEVFSTGELFRRQLNRAFSADQGYELLMNDWVRTAKEIPGKISRTYYMNSDLQHISYNPAVHEAYIIVTVARKK
jgi:SAM-dependent methyltransferase